MPFQYTGEDPYSLQNAGVYIGVGDCHAQYTWSTNPDVLDRNVPEVCSKHALANTISKVFNLSGRLD
ncbi:hypothetical protein DPMN_034377 [Dreissena polymorpha]|uniref:Uncharacterized protein n=1 Tax=Dreissena polymorpha TaxID=45954 RepID=A0A9D4RKW4_DREPO|nr:hypothetical protein DPMN_034377 [Dreissena polymorpha]